MEAVQINSLIDVDALVEKFLQEHEQGISTIHRIHFHTSDLISLRAMIAELKDELRTGIVTYWNKHQSTEDIDPYLFYIVNAFCKKKQAPQVKKKIEYLCPACLYLGKENLISLGRYFECDECAEALRLAEDPKLIQLLNAFIKHNKNGYRCPDCHRFLPHPLDEASEIVCPYFDCCFVGACSDLKRMHHPTSQSNPEKLILDTSKDGKPTLKDNLASEEIDVVSKMEMEEDLESKIKLIRDVIESQKNGLPYSSSNATAKHKYLCYQAFANLLNKFPAEMVGYLIGKSRSGGFQSKTFQEYIRLLEASFPLTYNVGKKQFLIDSLLDDKLLLFEGISIFEELVNEKLVIKNGTTEFYIGGRKGSVAEPYYMGKILNIVHKNTKESLMDRMVEYSFLRIKMRNVDPGTPVIVTHLRVPPHYQMGGMVYVNRVRRKIADRVTSILNKENDE